MPSVSSHVLSPQVPDNGATGREPRQGAGPRRAVWEESKPLAHQKKLGLSLAASSARWVMPPSHFFFNFFASQHWLPE